MTTFEQRNREHLSTIAKAEKQLTAAAKALFDGDPFTAETQAFNAWVDVSNIIGGSKEVEEARDAFMRRHTDIFTRIATAKREVEEKAEGAGTVERYRIAFNAARKQGHGMPVKIGQGTKIHAANSSGGWAMCGAGESSTAHNFRRSTLKFAIGHEITCAKCKKALGLD